MADVPLMPMDTLALEAELQRYEINTRRWTKEEGNGTVHDLFTEERAGQCLLIVRDRKTLVRIEQRLFLEVCHTKLTVDGGGTYRLVRKEEWNRKTGKRRSERAPYISVKVGRDAKLDDMHAVIRDTLWDELHVPVKTGENPKCLGPLIVSLMEDDTYPYPGLETETIVTTFVVPIDWWHAVQSSYTKQTEQRITYYAWELVPAPVSDAAPTAVVTQQS
jgi:hypothetical protein